MKKNKNISNKEYSIVNIEKKLRQLEKSKKEIDDKIYTKDKEMIKALKKLLIENENSFKKLFNSLAEISISKKYKYNTLECLNTLKEIFKENDIDSLSSFIYINNMFIKYKYDDLSVILKKITNIIEANKDNKSFLNKINQIISTGNYNILIDEEFALKTLHSCLINDKVKIEEEKKEEKKQEKINNLKKQYYENFKQIRK